MTDAAVSTLLLLLGERHSTALKCWTDTQSLFDPFPITPPASSYNSNNSSSSSNQDPSLLPTGSNSKEGAAYVMNVRYECARAVIELLQLPLNSIVGAEGAVESLAAPIGYQEALLREGLMSLIVPSLDDPSIVPSGHELCLPVSLISRLVLSSTAFAQQFVMAGGLAPGCVQRLMSNTNPSSVLVDVLLVVSQVRDSENIPSSCSWFIIHTRMNDHSIMICCSCPLTTKMTLFFSQTACCLTRPSPAAIIHLPPHHYVFFCLLLFVLL